MDKEAIKQALQDMLKGVADKARADAMAGESDIGSIFDDELQLAPGMDIAKVEEAILNVERATATKEGAQRLMDGIMIIAKIAARAT